MMITFNRPISFRHAGALVCAAMLASAVFTACDKKSFAPDPVGDEPTAAVSEKPMAFQTTSVRTKADGDAATTALPTNSSFGVFAYYQEGEIGTSRAAEWSDGGWTSAFMFNQEVTYNGGDSTVGTNYHYTPMKYWPYNMENTISFWAYYPYDANVAVFVSAEENAPKFTNESTTGIPAVKFKVPDDAKTDFMTADLKKDEARPGTTPNSPVNLLFHHRLASVRFKAKTDLDYSGTKPEGTTGPWPIAFTITKVELLNDYTSGVITQDNADAVTWGGYGSENTSRTFFTGSQTVTADAANCGEALLLLPQPMAHETNKVSVKITYTQKSGTNDAVDKEAVVELDKESIGIAAWADNQQYVYTITLGYNALYINPIVADWEDTDLLEYTLKMNTNMRLFDSWLYRYDTVNQDYTDWNNWAGSHMAVSEGRVTEATTTEPVVGRPLRSPQIQLVTTGDEDGTFELVIDNSDFEIVRANKSETGIVQSYDASTDGKLTIAAGDNVYTYFYIVPKVDTTDPANPVAKVSLIYNDPVLGPQKVTYNYNSLPGYSDDSSEIWAYYFPADQYNITDKLKMYFQDYNNPLVPTAVQN